MNLPPIGRLPQTEHSAFWTAVARYELMGDAAGLARACKGAAWNSSDPVPLGEFYRLSKILEAPFASGSYAKAARAIYRKITGQGHSWHYAKPRKRPTA